jgi:hypothetical protein
VTNTIAETYALTGGETLTVKVDGGAEQTVTIDSGSITVGFATAAEIAAEIDSQLTGATSFVTGAGTFVGIESEESGADSSIEVTGGDANTALGFPTEPRSGFNTSDALLGTAPETDSDFRLRRESSLHSAGASTVDAVQAALLTVSGVTDVVIFENPRDIVFDSLDPHSFEAVVDGTAAAADIAQKLWDFKPAGIETMGSLSAVATDNQGDSQTMFYSPPTDVDIFINVLVDVDSGLFGGGSNADGIQNIKDALVAYGQTLRIGGDVYHAQLVCQLIPEIAGVLNVDMGISTTSIPTSTGTPPFFTLAELSDISISKRQIANIEDANISVTATAT